ncbi:MAG TPA: trypsin-like peptidase domain-containing protein, partial [Acidimicrobiales bacterium]|nr:trypsin-like peptidase domain-containing protein [Acidimicrobiales bacterium]
GASGLKTVKLGDSSKVAVGDPVVAIGNALNLQGPPTVTDGTVTALGRSITVGDPSGPAENLNGLIETNALLRRGDSGGPLANSAGEVIGMNTAASAGRGLRSGASTGFAIPINKAKAIADQIKAGHGSSIVHIGLPAFMGVETQPGGSGSGSGAVLSGVVPHTPAQAAGLVAGDTIVAVDGKTVATRSDLTQLLGNHRPGDHIEVGWVDQSGKHHLTTVALIAGPAD